MSEPLPATFWNSRFIDPISGVVLAGSIFGAMFPPVAIILAVPVALAAVGAFAFSVPERLRAAVARKRGRSESSSIAEALASVADEPGREVRISGRIRTIVPADTARAGVAVFVRMGFPTAGRFVVEDATGAALVDDDTLMVMAFEGGTAILRATLRDGQEVSVFGPARAIASSELAGYRDTERVLAFDGTNDVPVQIVPL